MQEKPRVTATLERFKGRVFGVRTDTLESGGKTYELDIVDHDGSFAVAALPSPERIILVRQYRHAAGRWLWEIPAGKAESGESCEAGARRELAEETGFSCARLTKLCSVYPTPGFCTELLHIYAAYELEAGEQHLDDDEDIDVREFSFAQAWSMQASGEIADMKTVLALLWLGPGQVKKDA